MKLTKGGIITINIFIILVGTVGVVYLDLLFNPKTNWLITAIVFFCTMLFANWITYQILKDINKKIKNNKDK
jgi:biotin transporter BioY